MSYNIFKTDQKNITNPKFTPNQSITGNLVPLAFCVLDMNDDILPSEEFTLTLDVSTPQLVTTSQLYVIRDIAHDNGDVINWHMPFFVINKSKRGTSYVYECVKASKSFLLTYREGTDPEEVFKTDTFSKESDGFALPLQRHATYGIGATAQQGQYTPLYIGFLKDGENNLDDYNSYEWQPYTALTPSTDTRTKAYAYSKDGSYFFSKSWQQENWLGGMDFKNATPTSLPEGAAPSGEKTLKIDKALGRKMPLQDGFNYIQINSDRTKANNVGLRFDTNRAVTAGQVFTFSYYIDCGISNGQGYTLDMRRRIGFYVNGAWQFSDGANEKIEPFEQGHFISYTFTVPANATNMRCYAFTTKNANEYSLSISPRIFGVKLETGNGTMWCGNSTERQVPKKLALKMIDTDGSEVIRIRGGLNAASYLIPLKPNETYTAEVWARLEDISKQPSTAMFGGRFYDNNPNTYWVQTGQFENYYNKSDGTQVQSKNQPSNIEFQWTGETVYKSGEWHKLQFKVKAPSSHPNVANTVYMQLNFFNQVSDTTADYKEPRIYIGDEGGERKTLLL